MLVTTMASFPAKMSPTKVQVLQDSLTFVQWLSLLSCWPLNHYILSWHPTFRQQFHFTEVSCVIQIRLPASSEKKTFFYTDMYEHAYSDTNLYISTPSPIYTYMCVCLINNRIYSCRCLGESWLCHIFTLPIRVCVNPLRPSDAYMRQ